MAKEKRDQRKSELMKQMIEMYHLETMADIQNMLKDMFADTMKDILQTELDTELGYRKHDQSPKETASRHNGGYTKTVQSSPGESELDIPRDREGMYEPKIVPPGTKDVSGPEAKILSLYAKRMSDRNISDVVNEIYGFEVSHETISNIVDRVQSGVIE